MSRNMDTHQLGNLWATSNDSDVEGSTGHADDSDDGGSDEDGDLFAYHFEW